MEIRVLGPVELWEGGRRLDLGPRMPRAVLALLAMDLGRVVSLDRLIDQLWRDEPPPTATTALQGYVSHLRRVLEPDRPPRTPPRILVTQPPGYVLRLDPGALDAARFEAAVARGRSLVAAGDLAQGREDLRAALALWRGPAYAEFAFDAFAEVEAARLGELRAGAAETLAEVDLALGHHVAVAGELERLVTDEPLRERRWELWALALYRAGRQADALRALDRARRILRAQLGIEPGTALRQLEHDILAQAPGLEWRPPVTTTMAGPSAAATEAVALVAPPEGGHRAPLVGRDRELGQLVAALDVVEHGRGGVVLVAGEPGIGKTRLVEELVAHAAGREMEVAWGRCHEGVGAPAYWPWVQILRSLVDQADPPAVGRALGAAAADLAQIVPEVKEVPGVEIDPLPVLEPETARVRLWQAVVGFVLRLAAEHPVVLILDDLHWADSASLHLVRLLVAQLEEAPAVLVCTYREVDADASDVVAATLADLARAPGVVRVRPSALGQDGVGELVEAVAGVRPSARVTEAIRARSEGNPFFASELARLLASRRQLEGDDVVRHAIPAGVNDTIRLRLARLPHEVVALLGAAAVIGREFDLDVLTAAAELDDERVLERIEAALLTGIVLEASEGVTHYRFSHVLVRDAVYQGLSSLRRTRLHGQVAAAIQRWGGGDDERVLQIAHHLHAASAACPAEVAFDWAMRASEWAAGRHALEQAEEQVRRALDLLARMPPGPEAAERERQAMVQLGTILFMARGYCEPAVGEAWSRARELCREVPDASELLPALWGLWAFNCVRADFSAAMELAQELLEHGRRTGAALYQVIGDETAGITCWHGGRLGEALAHLERGAATCDGLPPELFAGALLEKHPGVACRSFAAVVHWLVGHPARALERRDEAVAMARGLGHPFSVVFALFFDAWLRVLLGDRAGVVATADEAQALARHHGFRQYVAMLSVLRGWADDDLAEMERGYADFLATGSRMLQHFFLGLTADVELRRGRVAEARATVEKALAEGEAVGERFWTAELLRLRGELAATAGTDQPEEPEASFRRALAVARSQGARALEDRVARAVAQRV